MKEKNLFLFLVATILFYAIMLFTNIGYATENITNFNNNYDTFYNNFNVEFNKDSNYLSDNVNILSSKKVALSNIVLTNLGEVQKFTIPIINNSINTSAKISSNVFNSNSEYFNVTCQVSKSVLKEKSDEAIIEVSVQLIQIPLSFPETTEIIIDIEAEPIY